MPRRGPIRVLIVEDHRTFAEALQRVIDLEKGLEVVPIAADGRSAVDLTVQNHPDVVLMDVEMPYLDGIAATRQIKRMSPETKVVMLSAHHDDTLVARAVEAGATGYLPKTRSVQEVAAAVRAAAEGESLIDADEVGRLLGMLGRRREEDAGARDRVARLTPRQLEILQRMADGQSPETIALDLGMSKHTLRTHTQNVLTKLGVHSKLEAVAFALEHHVVAGAASPAAWGSRV